MRWACESPLVAGCWLLVAGCWLLVARQDRTDIVDHIAVDSPRAAEKMDRLFGDAATQLGDFPMLGRAGEVPGTRELFPHQNYRMVYEVDEVEDTVWIEVLIHAARQWPPVPE